jgi:hypothetical protein
MKSNSWKLNSNCIVANVRLSCKINNNNIYYLHVIGCFDILSGEKHFYNYFTAKSTLSEKNAEFDFRFFSDKVFGTI